MQIYLVDVVVKGGDGGEGVEGRGGGKRGRGGGAATVSPDCMLY